MWYVTSRNIFVILKLTTFNLDHITKKIYLLFLLQNEWPRYSITDYWGINFQSWIFNSRTVLKWSFHLMPSWISWNKTTSNIQVDLSGQAWWLWFFRQRVIADTSRMVAHLWSRSYFPFPHFPPYPC